MHLTVVSYNIHRGVGLDRRRDLDRIADVIAEVSPDVVGLQEVIREEGVPHADQAMYLASRLDMSEIVMGETRTHGGGTYGNVVLTRLPVLGSGRCDLSRGVREPRGCLRVDLDIAGTPLHVFNCHFGLALRERREQLDLLGVFIRDSERLAGPRVLLGDFNEWLQEYASSSGAVYLDYFSALSEGRSFKKELTADGLVPNAAGYAVMAPLAEAAIAKALESP